MSKKSLIKNHYITYNLPKSNDQGIKTVTQGCPQNPKSIQEEELKVSTQIEE